MYNGWFDSHTPPSFITVFTADPDAGGVQLGAWEQFSHHVDGSEDGAPDVHAEVPFPSTTLTGALIRIGSPSNVSCFAPYSIGFVTTPAGPPAATVVAPASTDCPRALPLPTIVWDTQPFEDEAGGYIGLGWSFVLVTISALGTYDLSFLHVTVDGIPVNANYQFTTPYDSSDTFHNNAESWSLAVPVCNAPVVITATLLGDGWVSLGTTTVTVPAPAGATPCVSAAVLTPDDAMALRRGGDIGMTPASPNSLGVAYSVSAPVNDATDACDVLVTLAAKAPMVMRMASADLNTSTALEPLFVTMPAFTVMTFNLGSLDAGDTAAVSLDWAVSSLSAPVAGQIVTGAPSSARKNLTSPTTSLYMQGRVNVRCGAPVQVCNPGTALQCVGSPAANASQCTLKFRE